ncbi:hypothetical protein [Paenibacillus qinlingensis]|uniref:hypothetical protein n=1 Tax=Paenibacillus qinlingensis TaxID=1837343 RepID=UPI001567AF65|nr:hypothetical protein [Paenibacillus qinlingensis]NQX63737.1 hypothetical protein [Paenibacillus qinlingensis]
MRTIYIGCLCLILMLLTSCAKQIEVSSGDSSFIFTQKDIKGVELTKFNIKPLKNGKEYFYTKSSSKLKGTSALYKITLTDSMHEISVQTTMNLQSSKERAIKLFNASTKTTKALNKENILGVQAKEYDVDEINVVSKKRLFRN